MIALKQTAAPSLQRIGDLKWKHIMKNLKIVGIAIVGMFALFVILNLGPSRSPSEPLYIEGNTSESTPAPVKFRETAPKGAFYAYRKTKDYGIIAENNLFRPLGWRRNVPRPAERVATVAPDPLIESSPPPPSYALILTGIVESDSEWIAVLEDTRRNEGVFLRRGEELKDAFVSEIFLQHITLARGERRIQLALGERVEYSTGEQILFDTLTNGEIESAADTAMSTPANGGKTDEQQRLIERMRARRRRQLR